MPGRLPKVIRKLTVVVTDKKELQQYNRERLVGRGIRNFFGILLGPPKSAIL